MGKGVGHGGERYKKRVILQRLTFATLLLAVISGGSVGHQQTPAGRGSLNCSSRARPRFAPPTPTLAAKTCSPPLRWIPGGGGQVPSLVVLDLRNSCSLQIGDYVRGAHCSFWFLHLAGYIWQKPEWNSSTASVRSPDARSTDEILSDAK